MAFSKKTWLDRIAEYPTRRRLKKSDGTDEIVSVSREEGAISQEGDAFSAANMNDLEDRVASEFNSLNLKMELVRSHVGMIVQSTTLDTEAKVIAIYGGTSWSKVEGRFLLGTSSSYAVNSIGGEAAHTLTTAEMPSHTHTNTHRHDVSEKTVNYSGDHAHRMFNNGDASGAGNYIGKAYTNQVANIYSYSLVNTAYGANMGLTSTGGGHTHTLNAFSTNNTSITTSYTGDNSPHNNMPPYKVVYIWERTA